MRKLTAPQRRVLAHLPRRAYNIAGQDEATLAALQRRALVTYDHGVMRRTAEGEKVARAQVMPDDISATLAAELIWRGIIADVRDGTVPGTVRSFSALHDHRDANMYLDEALGGWEHLEGDEWQVALDRLTTLYNYASDLCDRRLREGLHEQDRNREDYDERSCL